MSASHVVPPGRMTAEEFMAWSMMQPGRYELQDGEIVGMASERVAHALMKLLVANCLLAAVRKAGLDCQVFPDGMAVRVDDFTIYEPDSQLRCGPPLSLDAVLVPDPMVVVEVWSPSTGNIDTGVKLEGYFRVPTIQHYLIVRTQNRMVIHHRRTSDGSIASSIVRTGSIALDPPGLVVEGLFDPLD